MWSYSISVCPSDAAKRPLVPRSALNEVSGCLFKTMPSVLWGMCIANNACGGACG